jgi:hypothetical protein
MSGGQVIRAPVHFIASSSLALGRNFASISYFSTQAFFAFSALVKMFRYPVGFSLFATFSKGY